MSPSLRARTTARKGTTTAAPLPGGRRTVRWATNAALAVVGVSFLLPLLWLVFASLDAEAGHATRLPRQLSLANFAAVLTPELLFVPLFNSFLLAAGTAAVTLLAAVLAAYPLSRHPSRFTRPFMYSVLFGTSLPVTAIMVPVYGLFVQLNFLDSVPATVFFMATTTLPMAIWMTRNFMDSVPREVEEAAWMDGASGMAALRTVVLPLMRRGLGVVFIFVFIQAWGNFFVPFILLLSPSKQPAAVSIFSFFGQHGAIAYGELAAFSILYSLPVLVLYTVMSRGSGHGFAMSGAMKG